MIGIRNFQQILMYLMKRWPERFSQFLHRIQILRKYRLAGRAS